MRTFFTLVACLWGLLAFDAIAEPIDLPDIGVAAGSTLSPRREREIGEAFLRSLRQQVELVEDTELQDYIQSLGHRLARHADPQPFPFTFFMVKDPAINAFAAPGGFIGIHTGLMLAAQTESELAGVLAHEIAHVTQRHMARSYEAAGKLSLPTAAAMLGAILLSTQNSEAGQAAIMAVQAGSAQYQINFTRANEHEADRIGIQVLNDAGLDPDGMPDFFRRLLQATRYTGRQPPEFLSTHPVTTDRIAEAEQRAARYRHPATDDRETFQLAKARLRVLTANNKTAVAQEFASETGTPAYADTVRRYGEALALTETGNTAKARALLLELAKKDPDRIAYQTALAHLEIATGKTAAAIKRYEKTLALYPGSRSLTMGYSEALLRAGRADRAQVILEQLIRDQQALDPAPWALLARAANAAGSPADSHQAMAEYYYLSGRTSAAVEQLKLALRTPGLDFYRTAGLEARLAELEKELSEAKKP